jgi:hypothetical protein
LKFGINKYELLGTIWKHKRDEKGEDEKGRRFLLCLEPPCPKGKGVTLV